MWAYGDVKGQGRLCLLTSPDTVVVMTEYKAKIGDVGNCNSPSYYIPTLQSSFLITLSFASRRRRLRLRRRSRSNSYIIYLLLSKCYREQVISDDYVGPEVTMPRRGTAGRV